MFRPGSTPAYGVMGRGPGGATRPFGIIFCSHSRSGYRTGDQRKATRVVLCPQIQAAPAAAATGAHV